MQLAKEIPTSNQTVLTVGNPNYPQSHSGSERSGVYELTAATRYVTLGGNLNELPLTGWEAEWLSNVFGKEKIETQKLTGAKATEANVRL